MIRDEFDLHVKTLLASHDLPYNIVAVHHTLWHGREEEQRWVSANYSKHVWLKSDTNDVSTYIIHAFGEASC